MKWAISVLISIIFLFVAPMAWSATYYVDKNHPQASNNNPGSQALPWLTIQKGATTAIAGDTVYVGAGTYNERVIPKHSGSAGAVITFKAYPGNKPIIDGTGISIPNWEGLVYILKHNWITVDGFEIRDAEGVLVYVKGDNVVIQNCIIHDNEGLGTFEHGVFFAASDSGRILNNEVYATNRNAIGVERDTNMLIQGNYVHDNPAHNCIDLKNSGDTVTMTGNDIKYNRLTGCTNGILSAYQDNQEIIGNVIYKNNKSCIWWINTGAPASAYDTQGSIFANNTCADNALDGIQNQYATSTVVKNNIFAESRYAASIDSSAASGHVFEKNLYKKGSKWRKSGTIYTSLSTWQSGSGQDGNAVEASPGFTDITADNYSITSGSEAIDNGEDLGIGSGIDINASWPDDVQLRDRDLDGAWDIGAYEYNNGLISEPLPPTNLRISSN